MSFWLLDSGLPLGSAEQMPCVSSHWVCFGDSPTPPSRGVSGVLGWLAGKVVYRYMSFALQKFLEFCLKPKSLTLKERKI